MSNTGAYYARWMTCDCVVAVCVDEASTFPRQTAAIVASYIRSGYRVERIALDVGRKMPWKCPEHLTGPSPWAQKRLADAEAAAAVRARKVPA